MTEFPSWLFVSPIQSSQFYVFVKNDSSTFIISRSV